MVCVILYNIVQYCIILSFINISWMSSDQTQEAEHLSSNKADFTKRLPFAVFHVPF